MYDYEAKVEIDEVDDAEIHFMIANEGLDSDKEEDSEVGKPDLKRKPTKICELSESDCEDIKVVYQQLRGSPQTG